MRAIFPTLALLLGGATSLGAQTGPDPGVPPVSGPAGCLREGSLGVPAFEFEGRRFEAVGSPEPIQADNLDSLGILGDLPVYAGRLAERPVVDLWVPVCFLSGHYQLYTRLASASGS